MRIVAVVSYDGTKKESPTSIPIKGSSILAGVNTGIVLTCYLLECAVEQ